MKIRIAVILDNIDYKEIDNGIKSILLFDVTRKVITAVGRQLLSIYNSDYLIIWLLGKKVEEIYINDPGEIITAKIKKCGIRQYPLEKIKDNPLLRSMRLPD